jgi:hypothetical protein
LKEVKINKKEGLEENEHSSLGTAGIQPGSDTVHNTAR